MDPGLIAKPIQTRQCKAMAAMAMVAVLLAGCTPTDAPEQFLVQGTATGVLGPVALALHLGDDVERLTVTQDGPFAFATPIEDGAAYTVVLADPDLPCTLRDPTGTIAGTAPEIALACTGASLASVVVSGVAPAVALAPGTLDYVVDLPLSQPAVTLTATAATPGDTLTIAGAAVASGAPGPDIALDLGDTPVDIVVENPSGWRQTYRLTLRRAAALAQYAHAKASNTGTGDNFGASVALSGDTLVVGAPYEDSAAQGVDGDQDDDSANASGAVYVFRRTGATWQQEAYLKADGAGPDHRFGISVALSGDTLAVGASFADSAQGAATNSGAVHVFRRTGATWHQEARLQAASPGAEDRFGASVALAADTLAVTAPYEDSAARGVGGDQVDDSALDSGAVYVFRRADTAWLQEAYLKASNTGPGDNFGTSVALAADTLAVGAAFEDSAATGIDGDQDDDTAPDSGAVYVFRRTDTAWQQEAYLKASNADPDDRFGRSVALTADTLAPDTLAIGAHGEASAAQGVGGDQADDTARDSGAVYVFRRADTAWQQEAYLKASNAAAYDAFGTSVALAGETLAVGATGEDGATLGAGGDQTDNALSASGAAYVFRRAGAAWRQEIYLKASNTATSARFGDTVALSGDTIVVGAPYEDSAVQGVGPRHFDSDAPDSGAVYIFH